MKKIVLDVGNCRGDHALLAMMLRSHFDVDVIRAADAEEALDALEKDHEFLLRGDVFTKDVIETWLDYKRKSEVDAIRLRPHPWEFALYFDI